ncbi:MAG TPA: tetratricopeptide repeat protein [Myxococcota bacterium]|nr:tetratricopeptide repeat protein [Myxococcota bacterium]
MRALKLLMCAAISLVLCSANAQAGDKKAEARMHFKQAQLAYKLGKFDDALGEYTKAYKLLPLPAFLFNIGQCQRQLKNYGRAIFFFKGYLREKPDAKNRALVGDLIKECLAEKKAKEKQARIDAERKRAQEMKRRELAGKAEENRRLRENERRLAEERAIQDAKARQMEAMLAAEQARKKEENLTPFYKTWWFWSLVGGAAAAIAGGTAYALTSGDTHVLPSGTLGTFDRRFP